MSNIINKGVEESGYLGITVSIGERVYKMSIDKDEEESVRKAAKRINTDLENMQNVYKNKDKQDLLAMIALLNTNELIKNESNNAYFNKLIGKMEEIDNLLLENSFV